MATNGTKTTENKPKKKLKVSNIIISVLVIAAIAGGVIYFVTNYLLAVKHEIKIEGKTIDMKTSLSQIEEMGFVLCNRAGKMIKIPDTNINAKEISRNNYLIGIPTGEKWAKSTGVWITPANFMNGDQKLADCTIYEIQYIPEFQDSDVDVRVDGDDMRTVDMEKWLSFFMNKGYTFNLVDYEEIRNGKTSSMYATKGAQKIAATFDRDTKLDGSGKSVKTITFNSLKIARDVKVDIRTE